MTGRLLVSDGGGSVSSQVLVTGAAGFIGSSLVDRLLDLDIDVLGIDNLSTGQVKHLDHAQRNKRFTFIERDLFVDDIRDCFHNIDVVFHLAANADVRFGLEHPKKDLEQNTLSTFNVLEGMRQAGVKKIVFSSTGSVYGEPSVVPTPENAPFPVQTSLYGASKIASEALISAYCEGFGMQSWIFRFVSILGERYSHGHVYDFYKKLRIDSSILPVLGDGCQRKSYLYIHDCIDAMLLALNQCHDYINIFNLGTDDYCQVSDSISWICSELGVNPSLQFSGGPRGWVGDSPFIYLNTDRIRALGWSPKVGIREGIIRTVRYLQQNEWLFEARND